MKYSKIPNFYHYSHFITEYSRLKDELGDGAEVAKLNSELEKAMETTLTKLKELKGSDEILKNEPNNYDEILAQLPEQTLTNALGEISIDTYRKKLKGAFYSRMAGCTLGAIVEAWSKEDMENWAKFIGEEEYPLTDYWSEIKDESQVRYIKSVAKDYTKGNITCVPCDDDTCYTILGLFIMEEKGLNFTVKDAYDVWVKYITMAYTAENIGWQNYLNGVPAEECADIDNPYDEWLGADIRCDAYGYVAAGNPRLAAKLAYTDAYMTHRRNGVYGAMFFAAAIAASFVTSDPYKSFEIALEQIPKNCDLAHDVKWALENYNNVKTYEDGFKLVTERFGNMSIVHTRNNACLSIFGCAIGDGHISKAFSHTVAMAHDNDCTAATTGSVMGACFGINNLESHWYKPFNNTIKSYFNGDLYYDIDNLLERYEKLYLETKEM